mgnify:CR=1 FL=1
MSLQRKKVTVRTKRGKTYTRSVLVKASEPVAATKRYMGPSRFIGKHKNQFAGMFVHGLVQGAATHTAARLIGKKHGKLAGAGAGLAAYHATDRAGTAVWKRAMGKNYDNINQDFARLAPHTERAMTRLFHGAGYAGNVVGAAGSWAAHHLIARRGKH